VLLMSRHLALVRQTGDAVTTEAADADSMLLHGHKGLTLKRGWTPAGRF
jgi:hypothetical protein